MSFLGYRREFIEPRRFTSKFGDVFILIYFYRWSVKPADVGRLGGMQATSFFEVGIFVVDL
jgi:hypothetical protein